MDLVFEDQFRDSFPCRLGRYILYTKGRQGRQKVRLVKTVITETSNLHELILPNQ